MRRCGWRQGLLLVAVQAAASANIDRLEQLGPGSRTRERKALDRPMRFDGEHFTIMTVEDPPFVAVRESTFNRSSKLLPPHEWHGWIVDLINATAQLSGFTYELVIPEGDYQSTMSYKTGYEGLVAAEARVNGNRMKSIDIFWAGAYVEPPRLSKSFMTNAFWYSPLALAVPHQNNTGSNAQFPNTDFAKPFAPELWRNICLLFIVSGFFYATIEPMNRSDFNVGGVQESLWDLILQISELLASVGGLFNLLIGHMFITAEQYMHDAGGKKKAKASGPLPAQASADTPAQPKVARHKRWSRIRNALEVAENAIESAATKLYHVVEETVHHHEERHHRARRAEEAEEKAVKRRERLLHKRTALFMHIKGMLGILAHSTYLGFSILSGANVWQPSTYGGKVFTLGVSFFSVIVVSTYTANLAVFLSQDTDSFLVSTLKGFRDGRNSGLKVCVLKDSAYYNNYLKEDKLHKQMAYVQVSGIPEYIEALADGRCHGVIERETHLDYMESGSFHDDVAGESASMCTRYQGLKVHRVEAENFEAGPLYLGIGFGGYKERDLDGTKDSWTEEEKQAYDQGEFNAKRMTYWATVLGGEGHAASGYADSVRQMGCFRKAAASDGVFGTPQMSGAFAIVILSACAAMGFWASEHLFRYFAGTCWLYDLRYALQRVRIAGNHTALLEAGTARKFLVLAFGPKVELTHKQLSDAEKVLGRVDHYDDGLQANIWDQRKHGDTAPSIGTIAHWKVEHEGETEHTVLDVCLLRGHFLPNSGGQLHVHSTMPAGGVQESPTAGVELERAHIIESTGVPLNANVKDVRWFAECNVEKSRIRGDGLTEVLPPYVVEVKPKQAIRQRTGLETWLPCSVTNLDALRSPMSELENLLSDVAINDLNSHRTERQVFASADDALVERLRKLATDGENSAIICYNWPRLQQVVTERWLVEPSMRDAMHGAVLRFLRVDFKLHDLAAEWAEDGVFLETIDELDELSGNARDAAAYSQFARHKEKLRTVLARFFKVFLHQNELRFSTTMSRGNIGRTLFKMASQGAAKAKEMATRASDIAIYPSSAMYSAEELLTIDISKWGIGKEQKQPAVASRTPEQAAPAAEAATISQSLSGAQEQRLAALEQQIASVAALEGKLDQVLSKLDKPAGTSSPSPAASPLTPPQGIGAVRQREV